MKLPRKSAKNTAHAMRILATAKFLKTLMQPAEKQAKAYLMEKELAPKDRRTVVGPDGSDIGTISLAQGRQPAPTITDPVALALWCDEHGIDHGAVVQPVFPAWFTTKANLEGLIQRGGGEVPDGLELAEPGEPYVLLRQSADQAMALRDSLTTAREIIEFVTPLEIEGGDDK